jgi:hypothetical protein
MFHYYLALDLGQSADYTALALIEEPVWLGNETTWEDFNVYWPPHVETGGWVSPSALGPRYAHNALAVNLNYGRPAHPPLSVRHLERFEIGTRYTDIIARVKQLLLREPIKRRLRHTALLVDKTGVGAAVVDGFKQAGVNPISITIHGGSAVRVRRNVGVQELHGRPGAKARPRGRRPGPPAKRPAEDSRGPRAGAHAP